MSGQPLDRDRRVLYQETQFHIVGLRADPEYGFGFEGTIEVLPQNIAGRLEAEPSGIDPGRPPFPHLQNLGHLYNISNLPCKEPRGTEEPGT